MQFQTASLSDAGGRRRNEDAFGIWRGAGRLALVVADGAGGHGGGDVASRVVVDTVLAELSRIEAASTPFSGPNLRRVLLRANDAVVDAQEAGGALADMRSTVVLLAVDTVAGHASWAHCGDTRLYCFRHGATEVQTQDHSVVQSMLDANLLPEQDVRHHPRRNVLFAALGTPEDLTIAAPDTPFVLADGDAFLLCTDGFWEYLDEAAMIGEIARAATPEDWLAALGGTLRRDAQPGRDNFTALALWCGEASQVTIMRA